MFINDLQDEYDLVIMLSTYNGENYLVQQIESIIEQQYDGNILLYVRDDGSTDDTVSILSDLSNRIDIKILDDYENVGVAKSFWRLLMTAPVAEYYAFVDQDDIWDKEKVKNAIDTLKTKDEMSLWFSNCRIINSNGEIIVNEMNQGNPLLTVSSQLVCGIAQGCAMIFNKKLLEYVRKLDISCVPMHDTVVLSYALVNNCVVYDSTPRFSYRVHSNNVVAKDGKSLCGKIRSTYYLWIKHKGEISALASDILHNTSSSLEKEECNFLEDIVGSRKSIGKRINVVNSKLASSISKRGMRSFKIRALLGLL